MTTKTLAERLRDAEADEKRLTDELLRAYRAGEFWLTPCAANALDAKDREIERLREAAALFRDSIRQALLDTEHGHEFLDTCFSIYFPALRQP